MGTTARYLMRNSLISSIVLVGERLRLAIIVSWEILTGVVKLLIVTEVFAEDRCVWSALTANATNKDNK